ncbi:protein kinase [Nostoc sp. CHAB 5834]|nr:protein kinase [Nostoc sp. CHAB 5834]
MTGPLSAGQTIGGRYVVQNYLDEGGMQFVYVARDSMTERAVALKTPKNPSAKKRFKRSAIVAAKVNHPNVAKTLDYVEEAGATYLIEELIGGKDLKAALLTRSDYVDPYLVAKIFRHLSKGVAAAHHNGVVHRDLKPTNIMIVGDYNVTELKVTDFGIAKMAKAELDEAAEGGDASLSASATALGAIPYMAPEAIDAPDTVGLPADVWSIGAIILHILYGDYPYGSGLRAVGNITRNARIGTPKFVTSKSQFRPLAEEIIELANRCLQLDPSHRPTADQLVEMCAALCYTVSERKIGSVKNYQYDAWGFIRALGGDVFFHKDSVFGELPKVNESVVFSCYDGGQAPRALPVLKLK